MSRARIALAVLVLVSAWPATGVAIGGATAGAVDEARSVDGAGVAVTASNSTQPSITAVYPNPIADGDSGEFVVVRLPGRTLERFVLTDGETTVAIPENATGRLAFSADPAATRRIIDHRVVGAPGLALANGGERVRVLRADGATVDSTAYATAPEGEQWVPRTETWRPIGQTPRDVHAFGSVNATVFTLPDSPELPIATIRSADDRVLLAGYTFVSERLTRELLDASQRGVRVRVLLDAKPVGGLTRREAALLDRLVAVGIDVRVIGGPYARFEFHHAKYAVVDDRALVVTENWKPAGTGGRSSRGWGVRLDSAAVAADLATLFGHDTSGRDAIPWRRFRDGRRFEAGGVANGSYPARFDPTRIRVDAVSVLTAPGNAEGAVIGAIDGADESVDVLQPTVERTGSFVRACLRAAKRGVRVRILLSSAWYVAEDNRRIVAAINDYAAERGLPIEARVASPRGRFEKIHAKGLLVDDRTVVLGSLNWNSHSARQNREVAVALRSETAATYFGRVFAADWDADGGRLPAGVALGVAVAVGIAVAVARREVQFR